MPKDTRKHEERIIQNDAPELAETLAAISKSLSERLNEKHSAEDKKLIEAIRELIRFLEKLNAEVAKENNRKIKLEIYARNQLIHSLYTTLTNVMNKALQPNEPGQLCQAINDYYNETYEFDNSPPKIFNQTITAITSYVDSQKVKPINSKKAFLKHIPEGEYADEYIGVSNAGFREPLQSVKIVQRVEEPSKEAFVEKLNKLLYVRWNEAARKAGLPEKSMSEIEKLKLSDIPPQFSDKYNRLFASIFGGINANDKITAMIKVRDFVIRDLAPPEEGHIFSLNPPLDRRDLEALRDSRLGRVMNQFSKFWPKELVTLEKAENQKDEETRNTIYVRSSK